MAAGEPAVFILGLALYVLFRLGYQILGFTFFRHPVLAGILAWSLLGDANLLWAAMFFELFWLDLFYTGSYIPPDALLACMVFLPLSLYFGWHDPGLFALPLLACLPLGRAGSVVEAILRRVCVSGYHALNRSIDQGGDIQATAESIARTGFLLALLVWTALYLVLAVLFWGLFSCGVWLAGPSGFLFPVRWEYLLGLATVGGLLALRLPAALALFVGCAIVTGGVFIWG